MTTFTVTTLIDENDGGDGGTQLSLREALALANAADDDDTITFAPTVTGGTIFLSQASQLSVATTLTIDGDIDDDGSPDITVSANTVFFLDDATNRVFEVFGEASATPITATLDGLVVRDGNDTVGGGILVAEGDALTLTNSTVTANNATSNGGGIFADTGATLILAGVTVSNNVAEGEGGGIYGGNDSAVVVTDSAFLRNRAEANGGGIYGYDGVPISLTNVTLAGNAAGGDGGAVYGFGGNIITVVNSTITGNSAGDTGGGIYNFGDGVTTLTNSIVAGNAAYFGGNDLYGGGTESASTLVFFGGNIIGSEPEGFATPFVGAPTVTIDGASESDLSTVFAQVAEVDPDGPGGNDPFFAGVAADNGGPVWTVALNKDSTNPALDGGEDGLAPPNDARGFDRHDVPGANDGDPNISDIGAFEQQGFLSFVVTTLDDELESTDPNATVESMGGIDDLSLREALFLANQDPTTDDTITFDEDLIGGTNDGVDNGHIALSAELGELVITGDVTVNGDVHDDGTIDITVDAQGNPFEVFHAVSGTSTLNGLVITGGNCVVGGGVLVGEYSPESALFTALQSETGTSTADLTITNSQVVNNLALLGAGIAVGDGSTLSLANATVAGNTTNYFGGGIANFGTATIINSTISGNISHQVGGGIANEGTLALHNVAIANNHAIYVEEEGPEEELPLLVIGYTAGGGLYNTGIATLNNTTVTGNSAYYGGGIYTGPSCGCIPSELTLNNTIVAGNSATYGPDLYVGTISEVPPDFVALAAPQVIYVGHNVFSQEGVGRGEPDDFFEPNLANIFATLTTIDPDEIPGNGDEFQAGLLTNNGGSVQTVAIVAEGVAHNQGDNGTVTPESQPFDARGTGFPRIVDDIVDIGAYEISDEDGPPEGSTAGGTITYFEDDTPQALDNALTVTDPGGLTGAIITIAGNFAPDQDVLTFTPQFGISGNYNPTTGVLTLTGNATDAQYQDVLRSVSYSNTSQNPSEVARTVNFQVDDGGGPVNLGNVGVNVVAVLDPPDDTNGDHTTDVVWRENTGRVALWEMQGVDILDNEFVADVATHWRIIDADSDFDGDGNSDILWEENTGVLVLWTMDGPNILSNNVVNVPIPDHWRIVDTGDFTADGRGDILWRESSGRVVLWEMNGANVVSNTLVADVPNTSVIEETGDFNGDAMNDILWRDPDGTLRIWEMDGATVMSDTTVATIPDHWEVLATGDFNNDERFDILWRENSGTVVLWLMDGPDIIGNSSLGTIPTHWAVADIGDYTGDLNSDILWRENTGTVVLWEMNGPVLVDNTASNTIPNHWQIEP
jgi:predicted outer membrane repeat protein